MKIGANSIRIGNVLEHEKKLWVASKTQHVQPGKGGAYIQVELKNLIDGTKLNERFRSSEQVERVHLEETPYQYLYTEGNAIILMHPETYEQIPLPLEMMGESHVYLQDGMIVKVSSYEDKPISVMLPDTVVLTIQEADPVVKGQTASSSFKPALLENGVKVMVPPHIESGMRVVVNTADNTYVERAKDPKE